MLFKALQGSTNGGGARRGPREVERDIGFEERIVITEELMIQEALVGQGLISGFF